MLKTKNNSAHKDGVKVRGFYRIQINENGKGVVGDSGWKENAVTYEGIEEYLIRWLTSGTGGLYVQYMALGTGTAPATGDTTLNGELFHKSANATTNSRAAVSSSIIASQTAQFTAAFASANSFVTAAANISNIGLFNSYLTSLANVGTLFAGNTLKLLGSKVRNYFKKLLKLLETPDKYASYNGIPNNGINAQCLKIA